MFDSISLSPSPFLSLSLFFVVSSVLSLPVVGAGDEWGGVTDYSYAGYHRGEKPLPAEKSLKVVATVTDFGAVPDDGKDDTQAFLKAIVSTPSGVIFIPAGRYLIGDVLKISKPNVVLRGAGMDRTTLHFTRSLMEIKPNLGKTTSGRPTSNYSWSGGEVQVMGQDKGKVLAKVAVKAKRGDRQLTVTSSQKIKANQMILIFQKDTTGKTLLNHLYSGDPGDTSKMNGQKAKTSFFAKVLKVNGKVIVLDRALLTDISPDWQAVVKSVEFTVTESGVEEMTIDFPVTPYEGHFTEVGYNGIVFGMVKDCWVRNVRISNCDSGVFLGGLCHSVENLLIESVREPDKRKNTGHHGFTFNGNDCLLTGVHLKTRFIHDLTAGAFSSGNVASHGDGVDLSLDHHKRAPHNNLFTDLDAGEGSRLFHCGGGASLGRNCGGWTTFWGIWSKQPLRTPSVDFGPKTLRFGGFLRSDTHAEKFLVLDTKGKRVEPQNLYQAQLKKRLGKPSRIK